MLWSAFLLLCLYAGKIGIGVKAQDDDLTCDDTNLADWLIALIDTLYGNGLSVSEELVVALSQFDGGYEILDQLYSSSSSSASSSTTTSSASTASTSSNGTTGYTLYLPTDSAWHDAGVYPPFEGVSNDTLLQLFALHAIQGEWEYGNLTSGGNSVGSTLLNIASTVASTSGTAADSSSTSSSSSSSSSAMQAVVLCQSTGNTILIQKEWANATTWSSKVDNNNDLLDNIVILPIDKVLAFPPNLSTALTEYGLTNFSAALDVISQMDVLQQVSSGGLTVFAPADYAFTDDIRSLLSDSNSATAVMGNLYTTNYTLYSPQWTSSSSSGSGSGTFTLPVTSGDYIIITQNDTGSFVALSDGSVEAGILQSDITIQNGVMHIIDTVLLSANSTSNSSNTTTATTASGVTGTVSAGSTSNSISNGNTASAGTTTQSSSSSTGAVASVVVTSGANHVVAVLLRGKVLLWVFVISIWVVW